MADMHVYVSEGDGHHTENLEAFIAAVLSGRMAAAYQQRFGHFGPKGVVGDSDPAPHEPTELPDLEPDERASRDDWE